MNKREYYYPVIGYVLLLVVVWLLSWLVDITATFLDTDFGICSLVSSEGVRWAMRSGIAALNNIAWGTVMLTLAAYGLLQGAGITRVLKHISQRVRLTKMETRSIFIALFALLLYSLVLYVLTLSRWNVLLGITGTFENSPFVSGLPILIFFGVLILALVYGFMYGNYRSAIDVVTSMGNTFTRFVPALIALIPASATMASVLYTGVFELMNLSDKEIWVMEFVFYSIPFMHIIFGNKNSDIENL
jgi:p-aminobenzoyl-glutamate transporter AbgT